MTQWQILLVTYNVTCLQSIVWGPTSGSSAPISLPTSVRSSSAETQPDLPRSWLGWDTDHTGVSAQPAVNCQHVGLPGGIFGGNMKDESRVLVGTP